MSRYYWRLTFCWLLFTSLSQVLVAQSAPRPIVSDRPGVYCGTFTLRPGQVQIETGLSLDYDGEQGFSTTLFTTPTVLRIGLIDDLEMHISTGGYSRVGGGPPSEQGFASQALGIKYRVVDADEAGGGPSMAFIFNLDLASGSKELGPSEPVPSLVFSLEYGLPAAWGLAANLGVAAPTDPLNRERFSDITYALAFSHGVGVRSGFFLEFAGNSPRFQDLNSQTLVDGGFTWLPSNDIQLDVSLARGISGDGSDWTAAGGISWRIN